MVPETGVCRKSSLYLNRFATRLAYAPAAFLVHYWGSKPGHYGNAEHSHTFFEICYVADGSGTYENNGIRYALEKGSLYATRPGSRHRIVSDAGMLLLFVAFDMNKPESEADIVQIYETLSEYRHLFVPAAGNTAVALLWQSLVMLSGGAETLHPEVIARMAHSLLYTALLLFHEHRGALTADKLPERPGASISLAKAEQFIHSRLAGKLTIREVAGALFVSERQLSRLLSETLGQSFPSWVRTERLRRAAYLLAYTDKSIPDIAEETGFETVNYFNRVFSQSLQITPGKFRKMSDEVETDAQSVIHRYLNLLVSRHQKRD